MDNKAHQALALLAQAQALIEQYAQEGDVFDAEMQDRIEEGFSSFEEHTLHDILMDCGGY